MFTRLPHPEPPPLARAKVGQLLRGKWHLDALIGAGGMATVYAATHRNGKRGALKILHRELADNQNARTRFLQEGYAANKVNHPGAVSVLDDDVAEDGCVFLVMELLDGESADGRALQRPGERLEVYEVVQLADQLLDVLAAAHDKGIVHRDIKPENIFLTRDGGLKVLDFGIARVREMAGPASAKLTTADGGAMGTPAFMPPEQALGNWDEVSAQSDLWAVGATMFTLLSGQCVHAAQTINQLLLAAMTKPAPPIAGVVPGVPVALAAVIDRALAFNAKSRWRDARAMQQALRAIPREQIAAAPSVRATMQSLGAAPAPGRSALESASTVAQGSSTVAPTSSDSMTRRRAGSSPLRRSIAIAAAVVAAAAVASILILRATAPVNDAVSAAATPSSTVNVVATINPSAPTVTPSTTVAVEPTAGPSASAPLDVTAAPPNPSGRPAASASAGKTGRLPPTVKSGKPKDPLEKF